MSKIISRETARQSDQNDPLAQFRQCFQHTENEIYLDGNSLGKLPLKAMENMNTVMQEQWGKQQNGQRFREHF